MEALVYLSDLLATVLLFYWAMQRADRSPEEQARGLFGFRQTLKAGKPTAERSAATTRGGSWNDAAWREAGWSDPPRRARDDLDGPRARDGLDGPRARDGLDGPRGSAGKTPRP